MISVPYSTSKDKLRTLAREYGTKIADYKENERITFWKFSNHEMFDKIKRMFAEHKWFPVNISAKLTKKQRKVFTYSNEDLDHTIENYSNFSIKFVSEFKILKFWDWGKRPMFFEIPTDKIDEYRLNGIRTKDFEDNEIPIITSLHFSYNTDEHLNQLKQANAHNLTYLWFLIPNETPYFRVDDDITLLSDILPDQINITTPEMIEKYY